MTVDYCDTEDELTKNPNAKRDFVFIANGDAHAYDFLWQFWCFAHCYDDLMDQEKPVPPEMGVRAFVKFLTMITFNPFWERNKETLFSFIMMVCTRWLDGDEWERSDDKIKRIVSHVVRCGDIDLYMHVALLTGGWDHLRAVRSTRVYDSNGVEQREII